MVLMVAAVVFDKPSFAPLTLVSRQGIDSVTIRSFR